MSSTEHQQPDSTEETETNERELSDAELEAVRGGTSAAAAKSSQQGMYDSNADHPNW